MARSSIDHHKPQAPHRVKATTEAGAGAEAGAKAGAEAKAKAEAGAHAEAEAKEEAGAAPDGLARRVRACLVGTSGIRSALSRGSGLSGGQKLSMFGPVERIGLVRWADVEFDRPWPADLSSIHI